MPASTTDMIRSVPKDVREGGIAAARSARESGPSGTGASSDVSSPSAVKIREDTAASDPSSDEEMRSGGWVRKKKSKKTSSSGAPEPLLSSLSPFRTNLGRWKHNQFQVLVFPGTSMLSTAEKNVRKVVDSVDVQL